MKQYGGLHGLLWLWIFLFLHSCTSFDSFWGWNWRGFCLRFSCCPVEFVDPHKTSGGSCLAVMCSCSNTWGAERIGKCGSWFTRGHENGYARAHHRGLQWWAALQLLAANGRNNLIAGEVLHPEHINTSFSLYEEVCEHRESIIITPDGFTSSFPGSDTVRQKKWGVLALLLEKNVSDAGYDLLSLQLFCWQIYIKSFLFIKYSVKYNENK